MVLVGGDRSRGHCLNLVGSFCLQVVFIKFFKTFQFVFCILDLKT